MNLYRVCWWVVYALVELVFRLRVEGHEHIEAGKGLVLASNHCSYLDPVLIGVAAGRELWYVTKRETFSVPFLGWLVRALHGMPIDRSRGDRSALLALEGRLRTGRVVLLFPEGTRNKSGSFLKPKSGVVRAVYRTAVPVVPVYVSGTVNVWNVLLGMNRATVRFGQPIRFFPDQLPSRRRDAYHSITSEVMRKIDGLKRGGRKAGTVAPAPLRSR